MFEANSLSAEYRLRDIERQFTETDLRPYRPRSEDAARRDWAWSSHGYSLMAYAVVLSLVGGAIWL